jgi:hypothetical protein
MTGLRFTYTIKRRIDLDLGLEFFLKDNTKDFTRITWFAGVLTPSVRYRFLSTSRFQPYLGGGLPLVDLNGIPLRLPLPTSRMIAYRVYRKSTRVERHEETVSYYVELVSAAELEAFTRR